MDQATIYSRHAEAYDTLVAAEDADGHLLPALESLATIDGAAILDVGCGTGRLSRLVAARASRVLGVDRARAMLAVAERHRDASAARNTWSVLCADAERLPVASGWADLAVAGWAFGHFTHWLASDWELAIGRCVDEMMRALRSGGAGVIIETLGTGVHEPSPPNDALAAYYAWLESTRGFERSMIRTDYQFPDVETAANVTGFFFGAEFGARVRQMRWARVPEFTGIWWRRS